MDGQIPFADNTDWTNTSNVQVPADQQQQAQAASVLARGYQSPEQILAQAQGGQQPVQPVAVPVPVSAPDTNNRAGLAQALVTALFRGAGGGVTAPFGSSEGGERGLQNERYGEVQDDRRRAEQNQQQQRQFENQLAANQDQRAQILNQAQITHANLTNYEAAHTISRLPDQDQAEMADLQQKILQPYKDAGIPYTEMDDTPQAMSAYFQAHPEQNATNTIFKQIHNPNPGEPGTVVAISRDAKGLTMDSLSKLSPRYAALKDNNTPISAAEYHKVAADVLNDEANKKFQAEQTRYNQQEEDHRAAMNRSTQFALEGMRERAQAALVESKTAQKKAEQGDPTELADGAQKGLISPDELKGMGAKIAGAVKNELVNRGVDVTKLDAEWKFRNMPQTMNKVTAINILDGSGQRVQDGGVVAKWAQAMKDANLSDISDMNKAINGGRFWFGGHDAAKIQTARQLSLSVADQYAKMLTGNGGSTDTSREQGLKLFNEAFGKNTVDGALKGIQAETASQKAALYNQSRYVGRDLGFNGSQAENPGMETQNYQGHTYTRKKGSNDPWQLQP